MTMSRFITTAAALAGLAFAATPAAAAPAYCGGWSVDGEVRTTVQQGQTMFVGGRFASISRICPGGALFNASGDPYAARSPYLGFAVAAIAEDAAGGRYIAGGRTLKHLAADGSLDRDLSTGLTKIGSIHALALVGTRLIVAGDGTKPLVAVDTASGAATPLATTIDGSVTALQAVAGDLVIAGDFSQVNGDPRRSLARVDLETGSKL